MDAGVVVALIGAAVSLLVAAFSARSALRATQASEEHDRRMRELDARLEEITADRSARRQYEYEARKRLYSTIEPLLFQLAELSDAAHGRILSLARTAAGGNLEDNGTSWLGKEGYYFLSTMHRLLAPLAVIELIRRQLTTVDLALDRDMNLQYELGRHLLGTFGDDFRLASIEPEIDYAPDESPSGHGDEHGLEPIHRRQGIYAGRREQTVNALIHSDPTRIMTFGEFEAAYESTPALNQLAYLFFEFHPGSHRVLWRVLIAQAHLYRAFLRIRDAKLDQAQMPYPPIEWIPASERHLYDWRPEHERGSGDTAALPFEAVEAYLQAALPNLTPRRV